jgi:hypothetical protein
MLATVDSSNMLRPMSVQGLTAETRNYLSVLETQITGSRITDAINIDVMLAMHLD